MENQNSNTAQQSVNTRIRKGSVGACIVIGSILCLLIILGGLYWLGSVLDGKESVEEILTENEFNEEEATETASLNQIDKEKEYATDSMLEDMEEEMPAEQEKFSPSENVSMEDDVQVDGMQDIYEFVEDTEQGIILLSDLYINTISASSELTDNTSTYSVEAVLDGNKDTCWAEGVDGNGESEYIEIHFREPIYLTDIGLLNGYMKNEDVFNNNGKISRIELSYSDGNSHESLLDEYEYQDVVGQAFSDWISYGNPIYTDYLKITILKASHGEKYEDTCLSELQLWGYVDSN